MGKPVHREGRRRQQAQTDRRPAQPLGQAGAAQGSETGPERPDPDIRLMWGTFAAGPHYPGAWRVALRFPSR